MRRGALGRTAKLFALPAGAATRAGRRLGRRIGGMDSDAATALSREQAAEQLFRVLGELKGGAMKVGQMLSIFESALPEDIAGPYRERMRRLQDSAPPMPASRVHAILAAELGSRWRDRFASFADRPAAAASIGQVHRAVWKDTGKPVAVKLQYPGADRALASDLRQLSRVAGLFAPLAGGVDIKPLVAELVAKIGQETDYANEAAAQQRAAEGFAGHPEFCVPAVREHTPHVIISDWLDGTPFSRAAELDHEARNRLGLRYVRFLFAGPREVGLLHGDPHPGNFKVLPDGRLGAVDFGLVDEMPGGLPEAMGRLMSLAAAGDARATLAGLAAEGFLARGVREVDPGELLDYLSPFIEPALVEEFHFSREWMRSEFSRVNSAARPGGIAAKLNLPPSYLLIHRVWLGGIAVLAQLDVTARFGEVLTEFLPQWRPPRSDRPR
nr:AarF/ABC1/UbiB kinase family protein [Naumannella cuiyingiana]